MNVSLWLRRISDRLRGFRRDLSRRRLPVGPASIARPRWVRPSLEMLEERVAPATLTPADAATTAAPPSQQQALVSLFLDGAALEATNLTYQFIYGNDFNIDNYYGSPSQLAIVRANAAAAGINYDTVMSLESFLGTIRSYPTIQPDIAANVPYAGPFAELAVIAGAEAVHQAAQQS